MNYSKAMHVMYSPIASALGSMIGRMDYHGKPELVAQQMGLSENPRAFDKIRILLKMHELVAQYHLNNGRMPAEVSNATPAIIQTPVFPA